METDKEQRVDASLANDLHWPTVHIGVINLLRNQREEHGEIADTLWQKLILDFPNKSLLFHLKNNAFDWNSLPTKEQNSNNNTNSDSSLMSSQDGAPLLSNENEPKAAPEQTALIAGLSHLGFIYSTAPLIIQEEETKAQNIDNSLIHNSEETFDLLAYIDPNQPSHLSFIYELDLASKSQTEKEEEIVSPKEAPSIVWSDYTHVSFVYEFTVNEDPVVKNPAQVIESVLARKEKVSTDPHSIETSLDHISFIYVPMPLEMDTQSIDIPLFKNNIGAVMETSVEPLIDNVEIFEESKSELQADSAQAFSHDLNTEPRDYVSWLKRISAGTGYAESAAALMAENKDKKKKKDQKDRANTAKKLLKKSKKADKKNKKKKEGGKKKKDEISEIVEGSVRESEEFITETYADLLANQGYIEKSIQMYEALMLRNPEKSSFFAAKIQKLKNK
jgi:hypothetical protein